MTTYLTQREAAEMLRVSPRYLRASGCPKVLLPSSRPGGHPLVRYDVDAVQRWAQARVRKAS